ncbi:MAG: helix-turn-helix domain-containing protein [Solirubrobacterales bacterium]
MPSPHSTPQREATQAQVAERLRAQRARAIGAADRDGLPMAAIAKVLGMSHRRVSQIVRS